MCEIQEQATETTAEEILDHIDKLWKAPTNGREIRNTITIERQLAQFKKEKFQYYHLRHVIKVGGKFENLLAGLAPWAHER
jgi:hypothetical protein